MSAPSAADADGILLELLSPIRRDDPYPHYRRLPAGAPARRPGGTVRGLLHLPLRLVPSRTG